jgi:hypothetical protein
MEVSGGRGQQKLDVWMQRCVPRMGLLAGGGSGAAGDDNQRREERHQKSHHFSPSRNRSDSNEGRGMAPHLVKTPAYRLRTEKFPGGPDATRINGERAARKTAIGRESGGHRCWWTVTAGAEMKRAEPIPEFGPFPLPRMLPKRPPA